MRRLASLAVLTVLSMVIASTAVAEEWGEYRDEFKNVSYSGSVGSLDWSDMPWSEVGDDGDKTSGLVHVDSSGCSGNCLHIFGEAEELDGVGAKRTADTSVFSWFEVCYQVDFEDNGETDAVLIVEKAVNGGGGWYEIARHELYDGLSKHPVIPIGGPYESMTLRFTVHGYVNGEVFLDDVEVKGVIAGSTTTTSSTTTTKPTTTTTKATTTTTQATTTTTAPTTTTTSLPPGEPTTTTSTPETTETTSAAGIGGTGGSSGGTPPPGTGIRDALRGIQVSFNGALFGDVSGFSPDLASVDHDVTYRIAAEVVEAAWIWLIVLGLLIGWATVSGLERRRDASLPL